MPHSMKYPTTRPSAARAPAAEIEGPATASGTATATAVRTATVATTLPGTFISSPSALEIGLYQSACGAASHGCSLFVNADQSDNWSCPNQTYGAAAVRARKRRVRRTRVRSDQST